LTSTSCAPIQEIRYISLNLNVQYVFGDPYAKMYAYFITHSHHFYLLNLTSHCLALRLPSGRLHIAAFHNVVENIEWHVSVLWDKA
jgi:hypothetical protein